MHHLLRAFHKDITVSKPADRSRSVNTEHIREPAGRERSRQPFGRAVSGPCLLLEPDWNLSMTQYTQRCDCCCNAMALLEDGKEWQDGRQTAADKSFNKRDGCRETEDEASNFSALTKQSNRTGAPIQDQVSQVSLVRLQKGSLNQMIRVAMNSQHSSQVHLLGVVSRELPKDAGRG